MTDTELWSIKEVANAFKKHGLIREQEQSGDLISRDAVIDIIHRFFTEEVDKIPTKKTEDGEVYVIHKCQPLFEMNKAICKRIKALPSASPTQNCVGNALDALDCISRQAVLEMAYDMSEIDGEHFTAPCMVVDVEDIQKLPSVNPQEPKWIPVSERLPEIDEPVLIFQRYYSGANITIGRYHSNEEQGGYRYWQWIKYDNHFSYGIDHFWIICPDSYYVDAWMPLPKPYEPQERSE